MTKMVLMSKWRKVGKLFKEGTRRILRMTKMVTISKSRKQIKYFQEEQQGNTELLPGLPNDVTVQLISTKLPWRTFHVLSSVSRAWLRAIRSGKINDTRVRSRTAETLAVVSIVPDSHRSGYAIALYSLRDKAFYRLPPHPDFGCEIPVHYKYLTTGGKIYTLGGLLVEMWVLDIAKQKKWQKCGSVHETRLKFGCTVFEGKIYIFGGWGIRNGRQQPIDSWEVYDPKVDAWTKIISPMKSVSMKSARLNFNANVVRDEILVHGGYDDGKSLDSVEAYNPAKNSWRLIPPGDVGNQKFRRDAEKIFFSAHGRLHSLTQRKIVVFDFDRKTVEDLHTCSVETRSNIDSPQGRFLPRKVLATDDGLLIIGRFKDCRPPFYTGDDKLYQSGTRQLGMGKENIVLEEVECSHLVRIEAYSFLEPIQL